MANDSGKFPDRSLLDRESVTRSERFPNESGRDPERRFPLRLSCLSFVNAPMKYGIGPDRRFFVKNLHYYDFTSFPICAMMKYHQE